MGVEYRRYLIPRPNTHRPLPEAASTLIDALRQHRWIVDPAGNSLAAMTFGTMRSYRNALNSGYFVRNAVEESAGPIDISAFLSANRDNDFILSWPVESLLASGSTYPLQPQPFTNDDGAAECYYELQLHFARDYVYPVSEVIDPFDPPPVCDCGAKLDYHQETHLAEFGYRITRLCQVCGKEFDPSNRGAQGRDGRTGESISLLGGAAYRFAIVAECGKLFGDGSPSFKSDLKCVVETVLGVKTYEVADFH